MVRRPHPWTVLGAENRIPSGVSSDALKGKPFNISISNADENVNVKVGEQSKPQLQDTAQNQNQTAEQSVDIEAIKEKYRQAAEELGLDIEFGDPETGEQTSTNSQDTSQPVQRVPWEELSRATQAEMEKAILQYANANDNMGQGSIRMFHGDDTFVQEFYNAYLQGGEWLDFWDAPTVDIRKLAAILDAIQSKR